MSKITAAIHRTAERLRKTAARSKDAPIKKLTGMLIRALLFLNEQIVALEQENLELKKRLKELESERSHPFLVDSRGSCWIKLEPFPGLLPGPFCSRKEKKA